MPVITVGTTPKIVFSDNPHRAGYLIYFISSAILPSNDGKIFIGEGFTPTADENQPTSGIVLINGMSAERYEQYPGDPSVFKGEIIVVANKANQKIYVHETSVFRKEVGK